MVNVYYDSKLLNSVRSSIVDKPEKEISIGEFLSDCSEASFMVCQHGKRSIEVFGANKKGWCDLNTEEFMNKCGLANDSGFARVTKKNTPLAIIKSISGANGINNSVVYSYVSMGEM